jgi:methylglyoxal synthase
VGKVLSLERGGQARASTVALVAHDEGKDDLLRFVRIHRDLFRMFRVVATNVASAEILLYFLADRNREVEARP